MSRFISSLVSCHSGECLTTRFLAYPYDYITEYQWLGTWRLSGHIPVCIDDFVFLFSPLYFWFITCHKICFGHFAVFWRAPGSLFTLYLY